MSWLLLFISILPIFLFGTYVYRKDREKESFGLLIKLFLFGIFSCFPALVLSSFIGGFFPAVDNMNLVQLFFYIFIAIALVEEFCKWFFVYKISYNHKEFDALYDMIVYSSFVALGFACFENILYVQSFGMMTGIVRAVSAVPGHLCNGILMGFYLGLSKLNNICTDLPNSNKYRVLSILIPTITHSIYDFCIFTGDDLFVVIFSFFLIILYVVCVKKVKDVSQNDLSVKYNSNYYSICGKKND